MRIAIDSKGSTELAALQEAWKVFAKSIHTDSDEKVEFQGYRIPGGSSQMPMNASQLMTVTRDRVEHMILQLKREKAEADYYVGLQSGFNITQSQGPRRTVLLENWAYVSDAHEGSFGHGGGIIVPPRIANPVVDRGIDLTIVMERFQKEKEIQSDMGLWGLLTKDILSARHSYVIALLAAFAPFYNREGYNKL